MAIPSIALKANAKQFAKLVNLGNTVAASLAGNLNFAVPAVTVISLQAAVTAVVVALAAWGPKNNRGSHASYVTLEQTALTLHQLLKAEAAYVLTTATIAAGSNYSLMATIISSSGFGLKMVRHSQGALQQVQKLRFMSSGALNRNQVKMVWERPLEVTTPGNVKSNNVYRSATTNFADAVLIDTVSKTEFIDTNNTGATITWSYFIAALGAAGEGAVSNPITITLLS